MKILGIIPARHGSKRLRRKNTMMLGGLPLWRIAVAQARVSHVIDNILITTDEQEILTSELAGVEVYWRPDRLCGDEISTFAVVQDAYKNYGWTADAICILQPTCPLRTGEDIAACVRIMEETGAEAVVSVSEGPNDLAFQVRHAGRLERLPNIVIPNGAIYLLKTVTLLEGRDWYGDFTYQLSDAERAINRHQRAVRL